MDEEEEENFQITYDYTDTDTKTENVTQTNGNRFHINFKLMGEDRKGILTCLKALNNLYSISISNVTNDTYFEKQNNIKIFQEGNNKDGNIYLVNNKNIDYNANNYMLIIGIKQQDENKLNVNKTILIINRDSKLKEDTAKRLYTKLLSQEEYLNLYYIKHFSLNITEFINDKYNKYKNNLSGISPDTARMEGGGELAKIEGQNPLKGDKKSANKVKKYIKKKVV